MTAFVDLRLRTILQTSQQRGICRAERNLPCKLRAGDGPLDEAPTFDQHSALMLRARREFFEEQDRMFEDMLRGRRPRLLLESTRL